MATSVEQEELVRLVQRCHAEGVQAKTDQTRIESPFPGQRGAIIDNPWPIFQEFYEGKQWKRMGRMPGWKSTPTGTECFQVCESMTTFITDNRAKAIFTPTETDDVLLADRTQAGWNWWCGKVGYDITQQLAVLDSRKFGLGWWKLAQDDDAPMGQRISVVNSDSVLVDPDCTVDSVIATGNPNWLIHEYLAPLGDLAKQFDFDPEGFDTKWTPSAGVGMFDRVLKYFERGESLAKNPAISVPVYELWIADTSETVWDEQVGELTITKAKKKYKGGRRIIVSGGRVLLDEANPYKHGQFPFTPIFAFPESGKFYCGGDIQLIIGGVVMLNRARQLLFDSTVKSGGILALVNPKYGLDVDSITNDPVQTHEVTDVNQALRFEQFPQPARHLFNFADTLKSEIQDGMGIHDISMGRYTPGNKTAQEVAALSESDKTRVRKAARMLAWANERIASQWLQNAAQFGFEDIFVRIYGDNGEAMPATLNQSELRGMKDGELTDEALRFDITIADSSTLPTYFQERKQMAMDLFDRKVIDEEALLSALEFPGWRAIVARVKDAAAKAAAKAAAQAPQMPPNAPQGAPAPTGAPQGEPMHQMPDGSMMPDSQMPAEGGGMPGLPEGMTEGEFMQGAQEIASAQGIPIEQVIAMAMGGQPMA